MFPFFGALQNASQTSYRSSLYSVDEKNGLKSQELDTRDLHAAYDPMRWICAVSHISLIILLASFASRKPDKMDPSVILFSEYSYTIIDTDTAIIGQFFEIAARVVYGWIVVGWTALLTLTAQKLARRRQLNILADLTSTHDANEAWMGIGAAFLILAKFGPFGPRASFKSILLPLAYLGGIASLHSIATNMFDLVPTSMNATILFHSTGIPDFSGDASHNRLTGSSALLTMQSLDGLEFPGLAPNGTGITYDIPDPVAISQVPSYPPIWVNATRFNVSCGSLSGSVESTENGPDFVFSPDLDMPTGLVYEFPKVISQQSLFIRPAPWGDQNFDPDDPRAHWPGSILVFSTVSIQDSSDNTVNMVPVNPPMTYLKFNSKATSTTSHVAALACNLTVDQYSDKAFINPRNNSLLHLDGEGNKTSAQLSSFPVTTRPPLYSNASQAAEDALISLWGLLQISSTSPMNDRLQDFCRTNAGNDFTNCGTLFEAEQFVMESLNVFPDFLLPDNVTSSQSIQLKDLENVLARMTAIEFWAEGQGKNMKFENTLDGGDAASRFVTHQNSFQYEEPKLVFVIYRTYLFVSLALAIFLLVLVTPSLLDENNLKIDSTGVLQMVWLSSYHPEMHQSITSLHNPSIEELRKEGLRVRRVLGRPPNDQPPGATDVERADRY
ncbi:hypothetical protein GYMLUDRAFT_36338 [Collybiopsis luxurians FD-317 M1]|nr:hypothetical protein GYMLUDRAFT_36338 [Collybiopsis luxurians FD-317 M1]